MTDGTANTIIVIGASAGGLTALQDMLAALPKPLSAPVIIAMHGEAASQLAEVLRLQCDHKIVRIEQDARPEPGVIYVVPGGRHAFINSGYLHLSDQVEDSGFRPSIDMLFMSAAAEYREHAVAVVLSGMLSDGMRGAQVVYDLGGRTIVQNPEEATYDSMPQSVIRADHPRAILTASELSDWLINNVGLLE